MKATVVLAGIVLAAIFAFGASSALAQTKLGYVESDKIVQALPEFKTVESKLQEVRKTYEDTLRLIQGRFNEELDAYQKQQATMNPEAKSQKEATLKNLQEYFSQYQQEHLGPQGTIFQVQAKLLQPIREKVAAAIEKVAQEEKLTAVMEVSMFMYVDKKANTNITFKVLDYLSRENK